MSRNGWFYPHKTRAAYERGEEVTTLVLQGMAAESVKKAEAAKARSKMALNAWLQANTPSVKLTRYTSAQYHEVTLPCGHVLKSTCIAQLKARLLKRKQDGKL